MSGQKSFDWTTPLAYAVVILIVLAIVALVFLIRLGITGGDMTCVFAQDPALCVAVKDIR